MLATAVALNLEGAPTSLQEEAANDPVAGAVLNGMNLRHILSTGLAALPEDASGTPFNASHVYATGNIAADMLANAQAEQTGRIVAVRLRGMTDDPGMRDMLSFLIARDNMHQKQWMAALEELGGLEQVMPVPNSFPVEEEAQEFSTSISASARIARNPPAAAGRRGRPSTARASSPPARWSRWARSPSSRRRRKTPANSARSNVRGNADGSQGVHRCGRRQRIERRTRLRGDARGAWKRGRAYRDLRDQPEGRRRAARASRAGHGAAADARA